MANKPPLGLIPKHIFISDRFVDVRDAISRYKAAGINVPIDWYIEYHELMAMLLKLEKEGKKVFKEE